MGYEPRASSNKGVGLLRIGRDAESILAQGFNLLVPSSPAGLSAAQQDLIGWLKESNADQSFEACKARNRPSSSLDLLLDRVDG